MDFHSAKASADAWTAKPVIKFELTGSNAEEKKLTFGCGDVSFYVVCPQAGTTKWHVWSENEDVLVQMAEIQDYVESLREKSLQDILTKVNDKLSVMLDADDDDDDEDEGMDDDFYYDEEDVDALDDKETKMVEEEEEDDAKQYFTGNASSAAVGRLVKDLSNIKKSEGKFGFTATPRGDNLFIWDVNLTDIPRDTLLGKDLQVYAQKYNREAVISMEMLFNSDYPMTPPFVRVLRPRFKFLTGHVTIGGSICMEMLTRSGWRPTNDIEGILVQVRSEILSDKNARLDTSQADRPYDEAEAKSAFTRMVQRYGWS